MQLGRVWGCVLWGAAGWPGSSGTAPGWLHWRAGGVIRGSDCCCLPNMRKIHSAALLRPCRPLPTPSSIAFMLKEETAEGGSARNLWAKVPLPDNPGAPENQSRSCSAPCPFWASLLA